MLTIPGIKKAYIDQESEHLVIEPTEDSFEVRPVIESLEARGYTVSPLTE